MGYIYPLATTWKKVGLKVLVQCPVCAEWHEIDSGMGVPDGNGQLHYCKRCESVFIEFIT